MRTPAVGEKIFCDKCKREILRRYGTAPFVITLSVNNGYWHHGAESESFDLCQECWRPIYLAMKAVIK